MKHSNENKYYSFTNRLFKTFFGFILLFILSLFLFSSSITFGNKHIVKYKEISDLDYKVYLYDNDFYEDPFLGKDMLYIANLIDKISIDFDYKFELDNKESLDFNYDIVGKLSITNVSGTKLFYEKEYVLLDNRKVVMNDNNVMLIDEKIDIDYAYYNTLANRFKSSYGVDVVSQLDVYMVINKKDNAESNFSINNSSSMNVNIPLSERAVDIKLDYNNINEVANIEVEGGFNITNTFIFILAILSLVVSIIFFVAFVKKLLLLRTKKNIYDEVVNKILKEYDRLIAETATLVSFDDKEVIKVDKFSELLDIHDNLQQPILYYSITKHQKCYFYIHNKNIVYLYVVKAVDLEVSNNEK